MRRVNVAEPRPTRLRVSGAEGPLELGCAMARDTNFYYSFLVLPPEQRRAILSVWDFCRAVDDAVDEPREGCGPDELSRRVEQWRAEVARVFDGGTPQTTQGQ